ncbi:ABC transporter permease [Nonomuraea rubra]|uniref:ABC transporter permease n=1 Tax=Nonomuraea rubra TaxID=46180 RepID=UPI0033EBD448
MTPTDRRTRRGDLALLWHQIRYEQLSFWRNPQNAIFTFVFPVAIMVIFGALFGGIAADSYFHGLSALRYYVPTIAALSVLSACYSQLAITLATRRHQGILKRAHATPLPAWTYFAGLLAHAVLVSVADVTLVVGVGVLYGVPVPAAGQWPEILLILVLGAAAFCALGVAVAGLIPNAEAAPSLVQLVQFPLVFISGTFMPIHSDMLNAIADILPVRPFNQALIGAFSEDGAFDLKSLAVLLIWGLAGTLIAVTRFRWDSQHAR